MAYSFHVAALMCLFGTIPLGVAAERATGLVAPTPEQRAQSEARLTKTLGVLPNRLALQRAAAEQRATTRAFTGQGMPAPAADGEETVSGMRPRAAGATLVLPRVVDNSVEPWFPPVGDQGGESSCVCWAEVYYTMSSQIARLRGWDLKALGRQGIRTPHFAYPLVNGGSDNGTYGTAAYQVGQVVGVPSFAVWPSGSSYAWPTDASVWYDALNYRMGESGSIDAMDTAAGQAMAKQMLANGYVLNYGTNVFQWQFTSLTNDPATTADDGYFAAGVPASRLNVCTHVAEGSSGHRMTIVGYDDDVWCDLNHNGVVDPGEKGAFRIINSWGNQDHYTDGGRAWLSYDAIGAVSAVAGGPNPAGRQAAFESNAVQWIKALSSYTPKMVAEITVTHGQRNQMSLGVGVGPVGATAPTRTFEASGALAGCGGALAFDGSTTAMPGTFVIDCTDVLTKDDDFRLFAYLRDGNAGSPGSLSLARFIDCRSGDVILPQVTIPAGGLPQTVDAATASVAMDVPLSATAPPVVQSLRRDTHSGTAIETVLNARDPHGKTLTYAITVPPAHGILSGTAPLLTYTPTAGFAGMDRFTFTADNGVATSAPASVTIAVGDDVATGLVADYYRLATPPTAIPSMAALPIDITVSNSGLRLLSAASFPYSAGPFAARYRGFLKVPTTGNYSLVFFTGDGGKLYLDNRLLLNNDGVHGTTYKNTVVNGLTAGLHPIQVEYFHGTNNPYLYLAWSGPGVSGAVTAANLVHYTFTPPPVVNTPPVAVSSSLSAVSGTGTLVPITLAASDADGDALTFATVPPAHGTLFGNPPNLTYLADAGFAGTDTFTFTANDGKADSNAGTVTIAVSAGVAANHAPEVSDLAVTTATNTLRKFGLAGRDADGDALTYTIVKRPGHGSVTLSGATASYTPTTGYTGEDSFTYRANDGKAVSAEGTVSLLVGALAPGLLTQFFALDQTPAVLPGLDGRKAVLTTTVSQVDYTDATFPAGMVDNFAMRCTGYLKIPKSGSYILKLTSDDGSRLWIDGVKQIDNDGQHGEVSIPKSLTLTAGYHDLRLEYFQAGGGKSVRLEWWNGSDWVLIPASSLWCVPMANVAPAATAQHLNLAPNATAAITLAGTDADQDPLTFTVLTSPRFGTLTGTAPNLTYRPPVDFQGDDAFTFLVQDGFNTSAPATVGIHLLSPTNLPPTVALAASAGDAPVLGSATTVRCLGADDGLEQGLSYHWSATGTPPAPVAFDANDSNAAKATMARFTKAGSYPLACTITDAGGLTVTTSLTVVVAQAPTTAAISPSTAVIAPAATQAFTLTVKDQFDTAITPAPATTWTADSGTGGTVSTNGLFTSNGASGGPWSIIGTVGSISATASVSVVALSPTSPPVVAKAATAVPASDHRSAKLGVLGMDAGGEPALTYTWSVSGSSPTGASFVPNGTNAAKASTVTFAHAGTYALACRIANAAGGSTDSTVSITVTAEATTLTASPAVASVLIGRTQQFTAVLADQFGDPLADQTAVAWNSLVLPCGHCDGRGLFTANATVGGPYTLQASASGLSASVAVTVVNLAPTIATAAAAAVNPVTGTSVVLTAQGADDGGAAGLTYRWTVADGTTAQATFAPNGTLSAATTTATFLAAGSYPLVCTITDAGGLTATSSVTVVVSQRAASLRVTPTEAQVVPAGTQAFATVVADQFGAPMAAPPTVTWTVGSATVGSVTSAGLFTAAAGGHGSATITASTGGLSANATVLVNAPPVVSTPAMLAGRMSPTATVSALGADDAGENALVYTWTVASGAPAPVTLSANGTNAAKITTVTFAQAGTYVMTCTITDAQGSQAASTVTAVVPQIASAISIDPGTLDMAPQQTQHLTALVKDQFGNPLEPQPAIAWTVADPTAGTCAHGDFTAGANPATTTVTATSSGLTAPVPVTVRLRSVATPASPASESSASGGGGGCGLGAGIGMMSMGLVMMLRRRTRA